MHLVGVNWDKLNEVRVVSSILGWEKSTNQTNLMVELTEIGIQSSLHVSYIDY